MLLCSSGTGRHPTAGQVSLGSTITGEVNWDHMVRVRSAKLHSEMTIVPLVFHQNLWDNKSGLCNYPVSHCTFIHYF